MGPPVFDALPAPVRALALGDVGFFARRFSGAGLDVGEPVRGVLTVRAARPGAARPGAARPGVARPDVARPDVARPGAARPDVARPAVLLSVGVHGDETGPIEMLAWVLEALARAPHELAVDLMLCVGHVDAIAAGKRFVDADLNRMFRSTRGDLAGTFEAARADALMAATAAFFAACGPARWHLDLHTAIRTSRYPKFAIVPEIIAVPDREALVGWLGAAGIEAVIMNPASGGTYSWWTAEHHGAAASTVELGRVGTLGGNDLARFEAASRAIAALLRGSAATDGLRPLVFDTAQTIVKLSDGFSLQVARDTPNFTPLRQGDVIATDGDTTYTVRHEEECIVFPNPDVRVGLRAGIMVVRRGT